MKAPTLPPLAPFALKLSGITLILLYLLDWFSLLIFAKFQDSQWLLAFTTQLVDRGFIPLIALALLFAGFWLDNHLGLSAPEDGKGLKLSALLLSSILGLAFLLMVPLHVTTTRTALDTELKRVADEATRAESQIEAQVQQAKGRVDAQLTAIEQAIKSGQLQGEQLTQAQRQQEELRKLKADPKALDAQIDPSRKQEIDRIRSRKQELETQIRDNGLRTGLQIGLKGSLLAIAYALLGWTGLRRML
jgi:hypothetical protein